MLPSNIAYVIVLSWGRNKVSGESHGLAVTVCMQTTAPSAEAFGKFRLVTRTTPEGLVVMKYVEAG